MRVPGCAVPFAAAAAMLVLAGCTSTSAPDPLPTTTSPSEGPSPSPSATVVAAPDVRVPTVCGDLADATAVSGLLGTRVALAPVPPNDEPSLRSAAADQLGSLTCFWTDGTAGDRTLTSGTGLVLTVVPDVSDAVWAPLAPLFGGEASGDAVYGPDSTAACRLAGDGGTRCDVSARAAGYWLQGALMTHATVDLPTARTSVLDGAVAAMQGFAAPEPLWRPADVPAYPAQPDCDALLSPSAVTELFRVTVAGAELAGPSAQLGAESVSGPLLGYRECSWYGEADTGSVTADVQLLPGGAWALPRLREEWSGSVRETGAGLVVEAGGDVALARAHGADLVLARTTTLTGFGEGWLDGILTAVEASY